MASHNALKSAQNTLRERQEAAAKAEQKMIDFLMQFQPAELLSVGDMKLIARMAKTHAFDAFNLDS